MADISGEELQERLEEVRLRLLEAIAPLPDEALLWPGSAGKWSIRDFLFLLSAWEAELVTGLMQIEQGRKPQRLLQAVADQPAYNRKRLAENPDRDLDRIFDDLQGVRVQLEEWLQALSDKELNNPRRYRWLDGRRLADVIAAASYEFEASHIPAVEAFAEQWLSIPQVDVGTIEVLDDDDDSRVERNGNAG